MPRRAAAPLAALLLGACAAAGPRTPAARVPQSARDAVARLVDDYNARRGESFAAMLDEDRFTNADSFAENIRQFLIHVRQVNLDLIVDGVDRAEPNVDVRAHWNRTYVDGKGQLHRDGGSCELLLSRQASGRLLLAAIHGASPF